jgi:hypothetical protein
MTLVFKIPQSSFAEASRSLTEASGAIFQQKNMRAFRKGWTKKSSAKNEDALQKAWAEKKPF